jgi:tetratricopeptide (TPR) repeat protein
MTDPNPDVRPRRLGDFELIRELGRGGMGVVYEAVQTSLGRRVALKVLGPGLGLTPPAVVRFRREAAAAAKLHHTNIVPVYATGEEHGTHFYAMELIDGPSLDRVLKQLRDGQTQSPSLPPVGTQTIAYDGVEPAAEAAGLSTSALSSGTQYFDAVARMVAGVADALDHAHRQGVLHRDVKPANLLLSPDGRVSLNDFGLARVLEQPGITITGEFLGTPAYMSPEQITGGRVPTDHRTDVYSLGATLYELLTLRPPFAGSSRDQVLAQILQKDPAPPRKVNSRVPVDLETICLKCLEKDPDRRYATAGALAEDLGRYLNRFAIAARRAGPVERLKKWAKRRPALAGALAGGLVAVGVAVFFAYQAHVAGQRLQAERRQNAVDRAILAAMGADTAGAQQAIAEAEVLGASTGQVRLLRGQVALYSGDSKTALEHLEQAVRLMPESVAARATLADAYHSAGRHDRHYEALQGLDQLAATTAEDLLFKGRALSHLDPQQALLFVEEAVRRRDSSVARLIRAGVRMMQAQSTGEPRDAEQALEDVRVATALLPGNPVALGISVGAYLTAAALYDEHGQREKSQAALEQAGRDVRALEPHDSFVRAARLRAHYFAYRDDEEALCTDYQRARTKGNPAFGANSYCHLLFRRGKFAEALEVLEHLPSIGDDFTNNLDRALFLTLLPDGQARALLCYQEACKAAPEAGTFLLYLHTPLLVLGRKDEAVKAYLQFRQRGLGLPSAGGWYDQLLRFQCGLPSIAELLKAANASRRNQCEAHYHIALQLLAEGDRGAAAKHFQQVVATRVLSFYAYTWSYTFLARLEKDPDWPPWIPPKK